MPDYLIEHVDRYEYAQSISADAIDAIARGRAYYRVANPIEARAIAPNYRAPLVGARDYATAYEAQGAERETIDARIAAAAAAAALEAKVGAEQRRLLREQAVANLHAAGELPDGFR